MLASFLMILFCACSNQSAVRSEVVRISLPDELLNTPEFQHEKVSDDKEVVLAYVKLYSFYLDLHGKISTIKKFNECFKKDEMNLECAKMNADLNASVPQKETK